MSDIRHRHVLVHDFAVKPSGTGTLAFAQPENFVDFSDANDTGLAVKLDVHDVIGTADSWYLTCKFQLGTMDTTGAGFSGFRWYDLQSEQVAKLIIEGVDWYGGTVPPVTQNNLCPNPSVEIASTGWVADKGVGGGAATASRPADGGKAGSTYYRTTFTAQNAAGGGVKTPNFAVTAGQAYSSGIWVRTSKDTDVRIGIDWYAGGTLLSTSFADGVQCTAGAWTRVSLIGAVAPATADSGKPRTSLAGDAPLWAPGDYIDADAVMDNAGATLFDYFDGTTIGAVWDGTAPSTSTLTATPTPANTVARSTDNVHVNPITVQRTIRHFGGLVRCWIQPIAVNASTDFAVAYSLSTAH